MISTFIEASQQGINLIDAGSSSAFWNSSVEKDRQTLEDAFRTSDSFGETDRTQILESWDGVWRPFFVGQPYYRASESTKAISNLIHRMRVFRQDYSSRLNAEMLSSVDALCEHLPAAEEVSRGLFFISEKLAQRRDALKAIEDLRNGFELIADNLLLYADWMIFKSADKDTIISRFGDIANINHLNEWFDALQFRSKKDREIALQQKASILVSMKAILWDLSAISGNTNLVPFVLDRQVTYLDANSAEGKALRRINKSASEDDDNDWIIVEPDSNIDIESLRECIASRGYKLSTKNSPSSAE